MAINYLTAINLSKTWGEQALFKEISFGINEGQKIALVARNGTGKTTLLHILVGNDIPDTGEVKKRSGLRIGFLSQNPKFDESHTIEEVLFHSENKVMQVIRGYHNALDNYEKDFSKSNEEKLNEFTQLMDYHSAWDYGSKIKEILFKLNLHNLEQKVATLSGGQRKKLAIASILIDKNDLLILDEPTNHLDIKTIEWLEEYLNKQKQAILMVTHDRYFLDAISNEVLEIDNQQLYHYHGNYEFFLEKKAERLIKEQTEIEKARNLYRKELEWMRRQPKARTHKSKSRIESFYEIEKIARKRTEQKQIEFSMRMSRQGKKILEVKDLSKSFGDLRVLDSFEYIFKGGERIGIVGDNGSGKTTFLNMLTGKLSPDTGEIVLGQTTRFGYFTQDALKVDPSLRVLEIVKEIAEYVQIGKESQAVSIFLTHFGFSHTLQHSYYESLSGGEKRKLQLLITLIKNPNFLILDEPTNDLDIYTLEKLEDFLLDYKGCLLIVSHDRYFLDKLADHLFLFKGNGKVKDFVGNYSDYQEMRLIEENQKKKAAKKAKPPIAKIQRAKDKPTYKEIKEFERLEVEIEDMEEEKARIMDEMNSGNLAPDVFRDVSIRYSEIERLLEEKELRWLELSEKMGD
jgi:ATP-binding cassette subfamily F protein uup